MTAERAIVFADFDETDTGAGPEHPALIAIEDGSPLQREWALICDSPDQPACVVGWEPSRAGGCRGPRAQIETMWSVGTPSGQPGRRIVVTSSMRPPPLLALDLRQSASLHRRPLRLLT